MTADLWDAPADEQVTDDMPHDLAAERAVLGSIMRRPELLDDLAVVMDPADFYRPAHTWIWEALDQLRAKVTDGPISPVALANHLAARSLLVKAGGPTVAHDLWELGFPASADYHAGIVAARAERRRFLAAGRKLAALGQAAEYDRDYALFVAQSELDGIVRQDTAARPPLLADLLPDAYERAVTPPTKEQGIPTGHMDLDRVLGGLVGGRLVVIGARPSVGKSTLGLGFARSAAIKHSIPTLFVSLEMSRDEVVNRLISAEARVTLSHITGGICDAAAVTRLGAAQQRLAAAPLRIDDTGEVTLAHLRHQVRTMTRAEGLKLLVVDYLQLMQMPRGENRQVQVAAMARSMKLLAKEFNIPVVLLSQLNRGPESRTDKRPTTADLRESGAIEQDADQVILLHREDMYDPEGPRVGEADFIVDKNRHGPRCTVTAAAQLHYSRFIDMAATGPWTPGGAA